MRQSHWKYVHFQQSYVYFDLPLHHAPDRSATFLTDLAGQTVKKLPSLEGPRFESRRRYKKVISLLIVYCQLVYRICAIKGHRQYSNIMLSTLRLGMYYLHKN